MARDVTARIREQQLREEAEDLGIERPAPTHREGPEGGYTARLAQEKRKAHDNPDDADREWVRTSEGTYQGPLTWGEA
jgi:hypothetical protein